MGQAPGTPRGARNRKGRVSPGGNLWELPAKMVMFLEGRGKEEVAWASPWGHPVHTVCWHSCMHGHG